MQNILKNSAAFILVFALFLTLAWLCGFTLDGVIEGHSPDNGDHPTNYYETHAKGAQ